MWYTISQAGGSHTADCQLFFWSLGADTEVSDIDGLPYPTLLYGTGPGHTSSRQHAYNGSGGGLNAIHASAVPRRWATHGGEDVPVYAQGPLATRLFTGTMDQSYVPHAIAYIACMGQHSRRCTDYNYTKTKLMVCAT